MKSKKLNTWLTLGANVGVLIGIIVLIFELNQNTDHLRLQLMDEINARQFGQNIVFLNENPAPVIEKSLVEPENITYSEYRIMDAYLVNAVGGWEDRYFLYEAGLVDVNDWKTKVEQEASWYLGNRFGKSWWENSGRYIFETEFADHVDQILTTIGDEDSYQFWLKTRIESPPY